MKCYLRFLISMLTLSKTTSPTHLDRSLWYSVYFIKNFELNKKLYEIFYLEENNTVGEQGTGSLTNWCDSDQYTTREEYTAMYNWSPCIYTCMPGPSAAELSRYFGIPCTVVREDVTKIYFLAAVAAKAKTGHPYFFSDVSYFIFNKNLRDDQIYLVK